MLFAFEVVMNSYSRKSPVDQTLSQTLGQLTVGLFNKHIFIYVKCGYTAIGVFKIAIRFYYIIFKLC